PPSVTVRPKRRRRSPGARPTHSGAGPSGRSALARSVGALLRRSRQSLIHRVGNGLQRVRDLVQLLGSPGPDSARLLIDGVANPITPDPHGGTARDRACEKAL